MNFLMNSLSERLTDVWKLLSETTQFLSKTKDFHQYEKQLRDWRALLQSRRNDPETAHRIHAELIQLRRHLRLQGYDLSLAKQSLRFEGFRNDACLREGFRRVVFVFTDRELYWLSGDDNHIQLAEYLEQRLLTGQTIAYDERIRDRHYLWYKREGPVLILSGSDTESKDDFERLVAIGEANPLWLLAKLKNLK
ncbi:MAG: hypothetical protein SNJ56_06775 [Termitinemataceae bacterium]